MEIPVFELTIDVAEGSFVDAVSLVDRPAVESNFMAFADKKSLAFSLDDEKKELIGAALIPDLNIYRKDEDTGEGYYVKFSSETVRKIAQVFFNKGFQNNMNIQHSDIPARSFIYQSYIVDESKGMPSPKGLNLPDGSWVIGVKVDDDEVWSQIKSGKQKGFSVEGLFSLAQKKVSQKHSEEEADILQLLQELNSIINHVKSN